MSVVDLVQSIVNIDVSSADTDLVSAVLRDMRSVRNWLDSVDVACARRLRELAVHEPAMLPEAVAAEAGRVSLRESTRRFERASTVETIPELGALLEAGAASGAHVDAVTGAMRGLAADQKQRLADRGDVLAKAASQLTPDEFARQVRRQVDDVCRDNGMSRLRRQKQATRLRTWVNRDTGMWHLAGEYDPETGLALASRLQQMTNTLFHEATPADAPADPVAKQQYLAAQALLRLTEGKHGKTKTELMLLIDAKTLLSGEHADTVVDLGFELDLPIDTVRKMAFSADVFTPVVTAANGVNLHLGRSQRLPNKAIRRALQAMYTTCAMPGCTVPFSKTHIHHFQHYEHGGTTDIDNLGPLCFRQHDDAHHGDLQLELAPDRTLTITYPDGAVRSTGPPTRTRAAG